MDMIVIPNEEDINLIGENLFKIYWKNQIENVLEYNLNEDEMYKVLRDISEDKCLWEYINNAISDIINNIRKENDNG